MVKRAEIDAGNGPNGELTTAEREELARLRRENKVLQMEREILRKATAFFAKETTWSLRSSRWRRPPFQ